MKQRVITALVGIPLVLGTCFATNPWFFGSLAFLAALIGSYELGRLFDARWVILGPAVVAVGLFVDVNGLWLALGWVLGIALAGFRGFPSVQVASLWIGCPLAALTLLHRTGTVGAFDWRNLVLMALIPLWIGDSAAIFVGKAFGKHPLAPSISPNKTWEGAFANLIGCVLGALGVGALLALPWPASLACGFASGILGQVGDLFQSALKRKVDAKDSGAILPGHGGVLDRIDSLLGTAIPTLLILSSLGK